MIVNLKDLLKGQKKQLAFQGKLDSIENVQLANHKIDSVYEIAIEGKIDYLGDEPTIHFSYEGMVRFVCERCLEPFDYELEGEVDSTLSKRDELDVDWLIIRDDKIDLTEAVLDDIVIKLPIQMVCSEACKGLCSECGIDLNKSKCHCKDEVIDPRLESLKKLFN